SGPRHFLTAIDYWKLPANANALAPRATGDTIAPTPTRTTKGPAMPNLRTPLYDLHVAHKAKIVEFGGWDMPVQFTGIIDEHTAVRTSAGLFDISHMGRLSFAGPDALDLIQYVYTNNAATMKDFQVRYGLVCNELGGIRDD